MDKEQLKIRAEKRRALAQAVDPQDSLVGEIGTAWLQEAAQKWNPEVQPKVPAGIAVGPEFIRWVKNWMKNNKFRILEVGEGVVKATAEAVASWIDFNGNRVVGIDYPNPWTEINKAKGEGYSVLGSDKKQIKTADSVYGPIDRDGVGIYAEPFEWSRYCPEHAGVMMRRVKDGVYQCPIKGEVFSYTDGHDIEIKLGVHNQTNPNWNKTWPQKSFLDTHNQQSTRASGGIYDEDSKVEHPKYTKNKDTSYAEKTPDLYANEGAMKGEKQKKEEKKAKLGPPFLRRGLSKMKKAAAEEQLGIADKLFGKTTMHSRYCPDHPGVSLYRIADSVFQCPLDRSVYDYEKGFTTQDGKEHAGGTIAEMTPNWPEFYQQVHPFLMRGSKIKKFMKQGQGLSLEYRLARDMERAMAGDQNAQKVVGLVIDGVFKGKALMVAAKEAYDFVEKSNQPAPKTIEVQEQPAAPPAGSIPAPRPGSVAKPYDEMTANV
jgi:hypothetical protein